MKKIVFNLAIILLCAYMPLFAAEKVTVFAASSTTDLMDELIAVYNKKGGNVVASYASSGVLAKQIESGAPADLFLSANEEWMDYLSKKDFLEETSRRDWLGNNLVLIAPKGSKVNYKFAGGKRLSEVLKKERLAMGDPDHAPAGQYAKTALEKLGLWDDVKGQTAAAENVRAVLTLVSRGEAPLGIVFGSDVTAAKGSVIIADELPKNSYGKISYPISLIKGKATGEAKKFNEFLKSPEAREIVKKYGFTPL
ncbi:MAG: molybdate ABC transporter substrate-binding protein [Deferribacteraceae bacterium]|jgi:molybdate transport system substrate-binding protein|nr:molybdate ABC transporter substrate-binding protein [Deferribacteraceae bacterium]